MKRRPRTLHPADHGDSATDMPRWFWIVGPLVVLFFSCFRWPA